MNERPPTPPNQALIERDNKIEQLSQVPLSETGLSADLLEKLNQINITTTDELLGATPSELLRKPEFGESSIMEILRWLKENGLYHNLAENFSVEMGTANSVFKFKDLR